jgi:hypothetical protein
MPLYLPNPVVVLPNGFVRLPNGIAIKAVVELVGGVKVWRIFLKDTDNEEKEIVTS